MKNGEKAKVQSRFFHGKKFAISVNNLMSKVNVT